jgi:biotin--protein ligase
VPGGVETNYYNDLGEDGRAKIVEYVQNGGKYLGLCAGAYFGCSKIDFGRGTSLEIIVERGLKFVNATAMGPVLAEYCYQVNSGARLAEIKMGEKIFI